MDQLTDAELMARLDDVEALFERLKRAEARSADIAAERDTANAERDAMAIRLNAANAERDAMAAERDAAVRAACHVLMMADGYAMIRERQMMRHLTCSAQHRQLGF